MCSLTELQVQLSDELSTFAALAPVTLAAGISDYRMCSLTIECVL